MTARAPELHRPLYTRMLRLTYIQPGGVLCFLFFEGTIALALLLSLADLVNWWSVVLLPLCVAGLVKINDVVAGALARSDVTRRIPLRRRPAARGTAAVPAARRKELADLDAPTEVIAPIPGGRAARRRATNQRRFAPASTGRSPEQRP
jgi:hypothetical protein